jgi:hypothetical protein
MNKLNTSTFYEINILETRLKQLPAVWKLQISTDDKKLYVLRPQGPNKDIIRILETLEIECLTIDDKKYVKIANPVQLLTFSRRLSPGNNDENFIVDFNE